MWNRRMLVPMLAAAAVAVTAGSRLGVVEADATKEVVVVNPPNRPVPTAAQGTTAVAGTVDARQAGPWSVRVDQGVPFQARGGLFFDDGVRGGNTQVLFVPHDATELVVVEHLSAVGTTEGPHNFWVRVEVWNVDHEGEHFGAPEMVSYLVMSPQARWDEKDTFTASHPVKMFVRPGQSLRVASIRSGTTGVGSTSLYASGYRLIAH